MAPKFKPGGKKFPTKLTTKPPPPQVQQNSVIAINNDQSSSSGLDEDAVNKFELELCWCIQQLEMGIQSGKMSEKCSKDTSKNLNLLKSNNVALVQKRQIMRSTFGDYRAKMQADEKKHGKTAKTVKFTSQKLGENKSIFIKKASSVSSNAENNCDNANGSVTTPLLSSLFSKNMINEPFTFNFNHSEK